MNISKILENTKPSSLPSWSSSSSSAFEKYNRINVAATTPVGSSDGNETNRFLNFPHYSWSNLNDLSMASVKTSHDQTGDEYSVSHFPKLNARPLSCRVSKKHSVERRPRTTFNVDQTGKLEEEYGKNEYVSRSRRVKLAQALDLTEGQVKIWFQNRRAKDKRIEKAQLDQRVRYIALNMALSCPSLIGRNPTLLDVRSTDSNGVNETL